MADASTATSFKSPLGLGGTFVAVDLFSGAGGLTQGFKMAGFNILVAVDIDESAKETYTFNHPNVEFIHDDMKKITGDRILDLVARKGFSGVDVLIGGPPCQAFSFANRHSGGLENPHSSGVWEFLRLIEEIKPTVFVMENVLGIKSRGNGHISAQIEEKARRLGYQVENASLFAADFGVPQNRKRTFLFGSKLKARVHFSEGKKRPPLNVSMAISDLPPLPDGGGGSEVVDYYTKPRNKYQKMMRKNSSKLFNHVTSKSGSRDPNVVERFRHIPQGKSLNDIWLTLPSYLKEGIVCVQKGIVHSNIYRRLCWDKPAPTIVHVRKAVLLHPLQHRLLSVREAARLQSFFDSYRFFGSVSRQYQQVADAVPVLMANAIAKDVLLHLKEVGDSRKELVQGICH